MFVLALNGQRTTALAQYEVCLNVLKQEFGVKFAEQTVQLFDRIRDGDVIVPKPTAHILPTTPPRPSYAPDLPVFVAREAELMRLDTFLNAALEGHGRLVFVTGEAGQGKTLLLKAFSQRACAQWPQLIVAGGNCNAYTGIGDPYLPFREIMGVLTGDTNIQVYHSRSELSVVVKSLLSDGPDLINIFVSGNAIVETARGLLMHEVTLENDRVSEYWIVAPTEWNFYPQGLLACWMRQRRYRDEAQLRDFVAHAVAALDPCVGWELKPEVVA